LNRACFLLLVGLAAPAALATVPAADRLLEAASRANREAGRATGLRLTVSLHAQPPGVGDEETLATGELLADAAGSARLDLVGADGSRERQLWRRGTQVAAWRDGQPLANPRPLLPPFAVLQAGQGASLRALLQDLGIPLAPAELGRSGEHDCFVVGGRDRAAEASGAAGPPALWLDAYDFEPVRVDRADGVRFRFGPARRFGDRRIPAWIAAEQGEEPPLYLAVRGAVAVQVGPSDFRPPTGSSPR
jgi:hypothetical protein